MSSISEITQPHSIQHIQWGDNHEIPFDLAYLRADWLEIPFDWTYSSAGWRESPFEFTLSRAE
jgi:hypothetical protein